MRTAGIVAEYNPFHSGHQYHIAETRKQLGEDAGIVAVMSGNWVQRGECALTDKWTRAKTAVYGGADLVLELPTAFACASAERFAFGAVSLLKASGVVTDLSFGAETGGADGLKQVAICLNSPEYELTLRSLLARKEWSYAQCRQRAVEEILGRELGGLLSAPNNNLAIEYLRVAGEIFHTVAVPRVGAAHDAETPNERFASASALRELLRRGDLTGAARFLPVPWPEGAYPADMAWGERAILARLRTLTAEDWAAIPDSGAGEGLSQRLARAGQQATSLQEFYALAKTRRYTHARLRRLAVWAFLGLEETPAPVCIRVLAFNCRGRMLLARMKEGATLPIVTKPAQGRALGGEIARVLEEESRCTDLYGLFCSAVQQSGREWMTSPVHIE